jgi:hypothetical protein
MSATRICRRVNAPRAAVYQALLDPRAVATWMVPDGMTSHVHRAPWARRKASSASSRATQRKSRYTRDMAPGGIPASHEDLARAVDALVDECRSVALWFLKPDYYPRTDDELRRVLYEIQKHADVEIYKRAARLEEWLSRHSSAASAGS